MSQRINLSSYPPLHHKNRSLLSAVFTSRSLSLWPIINIVRSFTNALPTIDIADLLGVPSEDRFLFKEWVDVIY
ncbi:hypothetical protein [Paenibacillus sp. UNC217MF]|uniref:hypothetical protein n=1 Tax=Paenibacillus sp. UNC217MF TaxID=1449062 RepID=UPI001E399B3D|nr:hypothetical protein [Paenibacillus sp. UNC217MF]